MARGEWNTCTKCGGKYRPGHYPEHLSTKAHERKTHAGEFRRSQRTRINERRRHERAAESSVRILERFGFDPLSDCPVSAHKRSRPNDGKKKVVPVTCYVKRYPLRHRALTPAERRRRLARARRQRCAL